MWRQSVDPTKDQIKTIEKRCTYEKNIISLKDRQIEFEYINPYKLKIGDIRFWPSTGRFKNLSTKVTGFGIDKLIASIA